MRARILLAIGVLATFTASFLPGGALFAADGDKQPVEKPVEVKRPVVPPEQLAAHVKEIFRSRCLECHGGSKTQGGVRILDHDGLLNKLKKVVPGRPDGSELMELIAATDEPMMPPPTLPRLAADDIAVVRQWIAAGAPPFPADVPAPVEMNKDAALRDVVGVDYVLKKVYEHVSSLKLEDRPYIRYFSINHLLTGGATRAELDLHRDALIKTINHLSWERRLAKLIAVDGPVGTVFAVDLREIGWQKQPYQRYRDGKVVGPSKMNLWDIVMLEYPYAAIYEDSETYDRLVEEYIVPCGLIRPAPYIRADWFVSVALLPPLYEDLLQLPHDLYELEKRLGVASEANINDAIAKRAGMTVSGVSRNNRVVERHPANYGAYWKSYDFKGSKGLGNMFKNPIDLHPAGGEMVFNLPNGLQGYFVTDNIGRRIDFAPTEIVVDKFAEDKTVRNGLSCIRCHEAGIKPFADNVRPAIERIPGSIGFDKRTALSLYVPQAEMDPLIKEDTDRFMNAMTQLLGRPQTVEPLTAVSRRFLDAPLQLPSASAELGLPDPAGLQQFFRMPQFVSLGLIPLASGGVVRRDSWEDYYDQIVRSLGLGVPVVPFDGRTRPEYPAAAPHIAVELGTTRKNNVFAPGDEFAIVVKNLAKQDIYIELIGLGTKGEQVILAPCTTFVKAGGQYRYPETGTLKVQGGVGQESIILYACGEAFPAGELLRGPGLTDRVVHPFYPARRRGTKPTDKFEPSQLIKKTLVIETK